MRQGVTRSLFQFLRRKQDFLSFNLMYETRRGIVFSQSRASRQEREFLFSISGFEARTRIEIETILARIFGKKTFIDCLLTDIFKNVANFSKFLKMICIFFSGSLNENLIFWDENGNTLLSISCFKTRTRNRKWFVKVEREQIKLILTGIPGNVF